MTPRRLASATILAVGSELTTGSTRDTNSGDLARALTDRGVEVRRLAALPDDLKAVIAALAAALAEVDLVVSTGGLGPTPDDLTREAIAAACDEVPVVDETLAAAMLELFERRGLPMPEANLKQAWTIPSSSPIVNANGTAPGWWVDRPDGRVIVALPGPPREMAPMWQGVVLPRLLERGLGVDRATETWRLTGIGESALIALIGDDVLRGANPTVATYARPDAVDVRISAVGSEGVRAADLVAELGRRLEPALAPYRFARGEVAWPDAIGARLGGRRVAVVEIGTGGEVAALLGAAPWFTFGETLAIDWPHAFAHRDLTIYASRIREAAGVAIGLAVRARERRGDMAVSIAIDVDGAAARVSRTVFLAGEIGRRRAAVAAATELWRRLGASTTEPGSPAPERRGDP